MSAGMQDFIILTGIVIKSEPIGEYDRRIVLLTKERGKISAFARGSRRAGNRLMAPTNPFSFGKFRLFTGRTSYNVSEAEISNYFEELRSDFIGAYYGMYFLEICDYYTRENNDETGMLKLLYQSLRALLHEGLSNQLVRYIFEIKALSINGEYPGPPKREQPYMDSTLYAMEFIINSSVEKLYTFTVTGQVLEEISQISDYFRERFMDRKMKSLEILQEISG